MTFDLILHRWMDPWGLLLYGLAAGGGFPPGISCQARLTPNTNLAFSQLELIKTHIHTHKNTHLQEGVVWCPLWHFALYGLSLCCSMHAVHKGSVRINRNGSPNLKMEMPLPRHVLTLALFASRYLGLQKDPNKPWITLPAKRQHPYYCSPSAAVHGTPAAQLSQLTMECVYGRLCVFVHALL